MVQIRLYLLVNSSVYPIQTGGRVGGGVLAPPPPPHSRLKVKKT